MKAKVHKVSEDDINNLLDQIAMLRKQVNQTIQYATDENKTAEEFLESLDIVKSNFKFVYNKIMSFKITRKEK